MGGVTYTGGCIISKLDGGSADGGFTLRLSAGTHHIDGKQALALARTRENLCAPNETDIQREEHQQALFTDMKAGCCRRRASCACRGSPGTRRRRSSPT